MTNKNIIIPDCPCCKHFYLKDDLPCCQAFPEGIPREYLWGDIYVPELKECNGGYKYEEDLD